MLVGAGLLLTLLFLLRNPILNSVIRSQLLALTGGEVEVIGARFDGLSRVRIDRIDVRAPGWEGPAGDVVQVENVVADLQPLAILGGAFVFDRITVGLARIRVAERIDDSTEINLASLRPPPGAEEEDESDTEGSDREGLRGLGSVSIDLLEIETGIADGDDWQPSDTSRFHARIDASRSDAGTHDFTLASIENQSRIDIATGTLDAESGGFSLRTDDVDLERGVNLALSATARAVVSAMSLGGVLRTATVEWTPGEAPRASLTVDDLAFTPSGIDGLEDQWVRFREGVIVEESPPLPRIELNRGTIELDGDLITIRGEGGRLTREVESDALPRMRIGAIFQLRLLGIDEGLGDRDLATWADSLLDEAPFLLDVEIDRFQRPPEESHLPIDLPLPVAEALEVLTARSWDLTATAQVGRGDVASSERSEVAEPAIRSSASLDLADGRGMYQNFEYPLHSVVAGLLVTDDVITVRHLTGIGPSGDRIELTGTIDGTGDDAGVDLRLTSEDIALDDALLSALPRSTEQGLRTLFDEEAAARLRAADLLPDQADIDREVAELPRLLESRAGLRGDPTRLARIDREIRRLRTIAADGPFELGGRGTIDLKIHRPRIEGHPVAVEGPIALRDVGGVFSRFPYPLRVRRGRLLLEDLAVVLQEPGFEVTTISGGEGLIAGRVDLPRDGRGSRDVHPELTLRFENDRLTPCLLAAVPPDLEGRPSAASIPGWPGEVRSPAVEPVRAMGLRGTLDFTVGIRTDETGDARFAVTGNLVDGTANPDESADRTVTDAGLPWPRDFVLEDVRGTLEIDDDGVELVSFTGRRGDGDVRARGHYDFTTERGRGIARLRDLAMEELLLDLVPADSRGDAHALWRRWNPRGRFNADLHWSRRGGGTELDLEAEPLWAELDTAAGRTRFERERGRIHFREGRIEVDDLALKLSTGDRIDGALRLDGAYGFEELPSSRTLNGVLDSARFQAPALEEVLRLAAGDALADWWLERSPEGRFEGTFEIVSGRRRAPEFDLDLDPSTFTLLSRAGDPSSRGGGRVMGDGAIRIRDRQVSIGPLELVADDDARSWFDIVVPDVRRPEIGARFRLDLPDTDAPECGFIPPPFSSVLSDAAVTAEAIEVEGEILARYWVPPGAIPPADETIPYGYEADGTLRFSRLDWDLGGSPVAVRHDADGLRMSLEAVGGIPTAFSLDAVFPTIDVAGRRVRDVRAVGSLAPDRGPASTPVFLIEGADGTIGDGRASFDVELEPETERYRFDATLTDVDLTALSVEVDDPEADGRVPEGPTPARLVGRVVMEGIYDAPETRVGRGRILVEDAGFVGRSQLSLLQLGQLLPPIQDELATAVADFWIDGGMVLLERLVLEAETITLAGAGELRLDDWRWSLRLQPSGRVPGWSDLVSAISGTIAAIDVRGTPAEPVLEVVPLPIAVPPEQLDGPTSDAVGGDTAAEATTQDSQP